MVDRPKLREAVGELVRNVLSALSEAGGGLEFRSRVSGDGTNPLAEAADDGAEQDPIYKASDSESDGPKGRPCAGFALTGAIVQ